MNQYFETRPGVSSAALRIVIFNALTALFLLATVVLGGAYLTILINPQIPLNPFPPPTLPPTLGPPTPTQTPAIYLPTEVPATPTFRPLPSATFTPTASATATETPTPTATQELTPPATAQAGAQFKLGAGSPQPIPDERGCSFLGVGGRVFDLQGAPIVDLVVRMGGELGGFSIGTMDSVTGSAADRFGFGGYYFDLGDAPIASQQTLWIQVLDASSGLPLSEKQFLNTTASCEENLILVNWQQSQG